MRRNRHIKFLEVDRTTLPHVLKKLGNTSDTIAHTLRTLNIRGKRVAERHSPISRYLHQQGYLLEGVYPDRINLIDTDTYRETGRITWVPIRTPKAVAEFLMRFDNGEFEELAE